MVPRKSGYLMANIVKVRHQTKNSQNWHTTIKITRFHKHSGVTILAILAYMWYLQKCSCFVGVVQGVRVMDASWKRYSPD